MTGKQRMQQKAFSYPVLLTLADIRRVRDQQSRSDNGDIPTISSCKNKSKTLCFSHVREPATIKVAKVTCKVFTSNMTPV